jgi:hypothetical protein
MALWALTRALGSLSLAPPAVTTPVPTLLPAAQVIRLTREVDYFRVARGERAAGDGRWVLRATSVRNLVILDKITLSLSFPV